MMRNFVCGFVAILMCACAAPPTVDTGAIQTVAAKTVVAEITARASAPASVAAPTGISKTQPQPPQGSPQFTPSFNPFANLTTTQRDCFIKEWGEKIFQEISTFTRAPSESEGSAIGKCLGGPPPGGAQQSGGTPPSNPQGQNQQRGTPPAQGTGLAGQGQANASNDQTWYATSTDGLNWKEGALIADKASVPDVIRTTKGIFWAYWVDFSGASGANSEKLGVAKSSDGKTWEKLGNVKFSNLTTQTPVDPDIVELDDGRLRLYFYDIAVKQGDHSIYSAVSSDGINFTLDAGVRFKAENIFDPDVVRLKDGRWRMFVNNMGKILSATSSDGLNFTADEGARVQVMGSVPGSVVLADGTIRLYACDRGINAYKSADGLTFTLEKENVFQKQGGLLCDPSVTTVPGGFLMVFKFNSGQ
ncbi:MAG: hypothetical protein HY070_03030 [Chloroflexi bacterium]|nr:hypothetical protein [Chloroflexota bacterium]